MAAMNTSQQRKHHDDWRYDLFKLVHRFSCSSRIARMASGKILQ